MEDFKGMTSRIADWLICQGQEKLLEISKAFFVDFMHAFVPCISSQNHIAKSGAIVACVAGRIVRARKVVELFCLHHCFPWRHKETNYATNSNANDFVNAKSHTRKKPLPAG